MKTLSRRRMLLVGLMLFFAAAYFYQDPLANGNSRLDLVRAIVENRSVQIDTYLASPEWFTIDKALYQGHYYSDKAPGSALLAVPVYFAIYHVSQGLHLPLGTQLIKQLLTIIVIGTLFALGGIAMYRIASRLTVSPHMPLIATLAVALGTMLWPYSAVFYGHVVAASFLIISFDMLFAARVRPQARPGLHFFVAGLAMGFAFLTEYTAALIILGLLVYAVYALKPGGLRAMLRYAAIGALGASLPLALLLAYNFTAYGNPFTFGYTHEASATFATGMSSGLMGIHRPQWLVLYHITLDPKFGLLCLSPVLLLAPIGYFAGMRLRQVRAESLLSLYAIGVMLLMNAGYYLWWGGAAFGPRLIIPGLPFMVVPLALLPARLKPPAIGLGGISIGQMLIPLMGTIQPLISFRPDFQTFIIHGSLFEGFSLLYQYILPQIFKMVQAGTPSWTLAAAFHLPYALSVPLLVAVEAGLVMLYGRLTLKGQRPATMPSSDAQAEL